MSVTFSVFDKHVAAGAAGGRFGRRVGVPRSRVFRMARSGFSKRRRSPIIKWMRDNVRFPSNWESTRFDLKKCPHVLGVIERFWLNPKMRKANLPWAVRSAKTTTLLAIMLWVAENDPAPMAILFPDQKILEASLWEHMYPMFQQMPVIRRQLLPARERNRKAIVFRDCRVRLANAGTVSDSSGYPALYIFKFEHDKNPTAKSSEADSSRRIESRCAGYARGQKIIEEGSPGDLSTSRAGRLLVNKNVVQFRRVVPCPHCRHHQKLVIDQLRVPRDESGELNAALAERETYYECISCKGRIDDHHRAAMMQAGHWAAIDQGEYVTDDGELCGELTCDSSTCVFGEFSILYSLFISGWGEVGREWVESLEAEKAGDVEARKRFVTEYLAQPWDDKPETTASDKLAKFLAGKHERGRLPENTAFLTTTADVGLVDDVLVFHWQVMAWAQGCQGAVIDWGTAFGELQFLELIASKRYPFQERAELALSLKGFPVGVDAGKFTTEVYNLVDRIPNGVALRGDSRKGSAASNVDLYHGGNRRADQSAAIVKMKKKLGIFDLMLINSDGTQKYREALVACRIRPGWFGYVSYPADVFGDDSWESNEGILDQLKADYFERGKWERTGPNEAGDNLRYGRALAERHTRNGQRWSTVELMPRVICSAVSEPEQSAPVQRRRRVPVRQQKYRNYLLSNRK